jgi:hypothetical protein
MSKITVYKTAGCCYDVGLYVSTRLLMHTLGILPLISVDARYPLAHEARASLISERTNSCDTNKHNQSLDTKLYIHAAKRRHRT